MSHRGRHQPAEPFFLKADLGERFCIYYPPAASKKCLGAFIYVHPFAEEMNKSRHMVAMQSRALAESGYAVLQLDLYGCGDSSGDFADATWEIWLEDIARAEEWILQKVSSPIGLWGLRLGAVLVLDYAKKYSGNFSTIVLWQPVINTGQYLTQFLRMSLAGEIVTDGKKGNSGTTHLRHELAAGKPVEIAGYMLSPLLANDLEKIVTTQLAVTSCRIHWFEFISESRQTLTPAGENLVSSWKKQGSDLSVHYVPCTPFWATQEISTCPALLDEMARIFLHEMT